MMKSKRTKDKLKQIDTTAYLLSKANRKRLESAINEMNYGIYQKRQLSIDGIDKG